MTLTNYRPPNKALVGRFQGDASPVQVVVQVAVKHLLAKSSNVNQIVAKSSPSVVTPIAGSPSMPA